MLRGPGNRAALLARMRQTVLTDPVSLLKRIDRPVLLLWGRQDAMIPAQNAQDYLSALPRAERLEIEAVGHLPQEERALESVKAVEGWLSRIR